MSDAEETAGTPVHRHHVIESRDEYLAAVAAIADGDGPVAVDAERASGYRYSQRAYLIQVFRRGAGTFLFDPPAVGELSELNSVISDVEWVFHAASQDLDCLREVGLDPRNIFDTELGARLAGLPRVGLGTVVESLLGVHLAKEHSAADWSTRPLPASWLVYAALDVELLIDLRDAVAGLLEEQGKSEIARQEFADVLVRTARPSSRGEGWRRLSGVHSVRGSRNLAVAKSLWEARDAHARETDIAPGRLVPDSSLVAAAKALPTSKRELASLREFIGRASRTELPRWWTAIEEGLASTEVLTLRVPGADTIPPPKSWPDRNPEADRRLKMARPRVAEHAESLALPLENLLTPDTLRRVAWSPPEPLTSDALSDSLATLGARPWQIDATVQIIHQAFVDATQVDPEAEESPS